MSLVWPEAAQFLDPKRTGKRLANPSDVSKRVHNPISCRQSLQNFRQIIGPKPVVAEFCRTLF